MKRNGKEFDVTDPNVIFPWVYECISKHCRRYDFRRFLCSDICGMTIKEYKIALENKELFRKPAMLAAEEAVRRIKQRDLALPLVSIKKRRDKSSRKIREIGCESPMHQIFDYIAVKASMPIFRRRLTAEQCSSIKGRGPCYGAGRISKWLRKDKAGAEYAQRHGIRYTRKCKYFVKIDIEKCFPSLRSETFMARYERDCNNPDLIWLWHELFETHKVNGYEGFMIGALPSQWGAQYVMSFLYRFVTGLHYVRRGKSIPMVAHCLTYMDDMLLLGSNRNKLIQAVHELEKFASDQFGLGIKQTWQIVQIDSTPVDMMGFLIHADGIVTVRPRIFLRARRMALKANRRGGMVLPQALRIVAYKGYFFQRAGPIRRVLKSYRVNRKYNLDHVFKQAQLIISESAKAAGM